jgi:lipoprotein-releasing system permease protein
VKKNSGISFFVALRYLFSPKKHNIINIISIISVLGIMASTAALVIVLSVFNGMQDLVVSNFNRFNSTLKIEAKKGKLFAVCDLQFTISDLENIEGVSAVEQVLSDLVLITYDDKQTLSTLYGVSESFPKQTQLAEMMIDGNFETASKNGIVLGSGIAGLLGIELNDYELVKLYYPKRNKKNLSNPMDAFQICYARPVGVFESNTPYDANALFVHTRLAEVMFDIDNEISFIAVYLYDNAKLKIVQKKITQIVGDDFIVQNQIQQEALLFKVIKAENLVVYLILSFIFVIATLNIVGILGMLIIEKKQDISILHTLGASKALVKKIFLIVGAMIGTLGGLLGICLGLFCCVIQQYFGIITLGNAESSYIISAYPVSISLIDIVLIFFLIISMSLLTSWGSLRGLKSNNLKNKY